MLVGPSGCGKSTTLRMIAGPRGDHRRRHRDRRQRGERRPAQGPRHRHGVPELRALPAHERLREHVVRAEAQEDAQAGDRPAGAAGGADPRHHRAARPQAQAALGRPAPARRHGPRHRARSQGVPVRRAALQPRRQAARADAHRDQEGAPEGAHHDGLRHPRPGRGDDARRPGGGDECRPDRAGRHAQRPLPFAGHQVRGGLHRLAGDELHPLPARPGRRRAAHTAGRQARLPGARRAAPRATSPMSASPTWCSAFAPSTSWRPGRTSSRTSTTSTR